MKSKILAICVGLSALMNAACSVDTVGSSQINAQSIHENYSITYDADKNTTEAWAQFRVGGSTGTTVELEAPSRVSANNVPMAKTNFLGTYYSLNMAGLVTNVTINYIDGNGGRRDYPAQVLPANLAITSTTVSKSMPYTATVDVPGLRYGEYAYLQITQSLPDTYIIASATVSSSGVVTIPASETAKLRVGQPAQVVVSRTFRPGMTASLVTEAISHRFTIQVGQ